MINAYIYSLLGTGFSFLGTLIGAALVFFIKKEMKNSANNAILGFASGIMIAASVWSLLLPSIEMCEQYGQIPWVHTSLGFLSGGAFLFVLDRLLPHIHFNSEKPEGIKANFKFATMLVFAVTLHNIPEGMAVGLTFALASTDNSTAALSTAMVLSLGMALQNLPEGAAISLPLKKQGYSKTKSFFYGAASGIVEPIAGIIGVVLALSIVNIMPFMLSFAAGAMIYVVIEELMPEAYHEHSHASTISAMLGFTLMMVLDTAIG